MKGRILALSFALTLLPAWAHAQTRTQPALRDQLMPASASVAAAPAMNVKAETKEIAQPVALHHSSGAGYMIAGAALFVAGLLVDGDAGTILVLAGAGIGAYGLYLHFR